MSFIPQAPRRPWYLSSFMAEKPGSGTMSFSRSGVTGQRIFNVPWTQRLAALSRLLGNGTGGITYPDYFDNDFNWLYCWDAELRGEDMLGADSGGRIRYHQCIITAKYSILDLGVRFSINGQVYSTLGSFWVWAGKTLGADWEKDSKGNPIPFEETVGQVVPEGELSIEKRQVANPNFVDIIFKIGNVNEDAFFNFPPGTLLFCGCEAERTRNSVGTICWTLSYKFLMKVKDHRSLFRPGKADWYFIKTRTANESDSKYMYEETAFADLLAYI